MDKAGGLGSLERGLPGLGRAPPRAIPVAERLRTNTTVPTLSLTKLLRIGEGRTVKRLGHLATEVEALAPEVEALTDDELRGKTAEFKQRYANGETLDELL